VRKEKQVPIPCGIPYIFGTLGSPEKNLIPDSVLETNRIDLLIAEATKIDRQQHKLLTAEDIAMFQMGTHPALTASPIAYPLVNAAEVALARM
jgi:hypothetical protein